MLTIYTNQDLRGRSFKEFETLFESDFSNADLRGANFSGINLEGATFTGAKFGQQFHWKVFTLFGSLLITFIASGVAAFSGANIAQPFSITALIQELLDSLQGMVPLIKATGDIAGNSTASFTSTSHIDVTIWAITSFWILFFLFIRRLIFKGFKGIPWYIGRIFLVGMVLLLASSAAVVLAFFFGSTTLFSIFQIVIAISTSAISTAITASLLLIAAILLSVAIVIASSVAPAWLAGIIGALFMIVALLWGLTSLATITAVMADQSVSPLWVFLSLAVTLLGTVLVLGLILWISWQTLLEKTNYIWLRSLGLSFAAIGGTSFKGADLTNADFSQTELTRCDFRDATLTNTNWLGANDLETSRLGKTYLGVHTIQELVVTKDGRSKKFNQLSMVGLNLQNANLEGASFAGTDCSQTNFEGANLTDARLIRTKLERAILKKSKLTGACIENWAITQSTRLDDIDCDYVFTRSDTQGNPTDESRLPSQDTFEIGEFSDYFSQLSLSFKAGYSFNSQAKDCIKPFAVVGSLRKLVNDSAIKGKPLSVKVLAVEVIEQRILLRISSSAPDIEVQYLENYESLVQAGKFDYFTEEDRRSIELLEGVIKQVRRQPRNIYFYNKGVLVEANYISTTIRQRPSKNIDATNNLSVKGKDLNRGTSAKGDVEYYRAYDNYPKAHMNTSDFTNTSSFSEQTAQDKKTDDENIVVIDNSGMFFNANKMDNKFIEEDKSTNINQNITGSGNVVAGGNMNITDSNIGNTFAQDDSQERYQQMDLPALLNEFKSLVQSDDEIGNYDKRDALECIEKLETLIQQSQDSKAKDDASFQHHKLKRWHDAISSQTSFAANLATLLSLIGPRIVQVFSGII